MIGGWLFHKVAMLLKHRGAKWDPFLHDWARSAIEWGALYFTFAGFTAIALGTSLMIGLQLEENFDRPWAATNLIDFWMRWHMTLTRWCRDYVFRPVTALTRSALAGLVMAMLAIGLWHEFSFYYVAWSAWQVLGIVLTRTGIRRLPLARIPGAVRVVLGPISVLGWLSLASPVIHRGLEMLK